MMTNATTMASQIGHGAPNHIHDRTSLTSFGGTNVPGVPSLAPQTVQAGAVAANRMGPGAALNSVPHC